VKRNTREFANPLAPHCNPRYSSVFLVFLGFLRLLRFHPEKHYRYRKHLVRRLNAQIGGCGAVDALGAFAAGHQRVVYAAIGWLEVSGIVAATTLPAFPSFDSS
jgi:hypothetical protein